MEVKIRVRVRGQVTHECVAAYVVAEGELRVEEMYTPDCVDGEEAA